MAEGSVITEEMRAALDKESPPWPVEVERGAIRQFARSARYDNMIYFDVEAARAAGYPDLPCPPGFFGRYVFIPGRSDETFSSPRGMEDFPSGQFDKILNGGQFTRISRRIYAAESLTASGRFTNLREREGRMGHMIIVDFVISYRDADGKLVAEAGETSIRYQ